MPTYNFLIKCIECDGEGEYQLSSNPSSPIHECRYWQNGWTEETDFYDSIKDLQQDYPDAVDIIDVDDEEA